MAFKENFDKILNANNFTRIVKILATLLISVVLVGFLLGIIKTFLDLQLLIKSTIEIGLKQMLLNVLILLAVIEVLKTGLSYITEGRVRVTFIVDTVLIVMLNEVIAFWFKGEHSNYIPLVVVLFTLIIIRILAIKFSPDACSE